MTKNDYVRVVAAIRDYVDREMHASDLADTYDHDDASGEAMQAFSVRDETRGETAAFVKGLRMLADPHAVDLAMREARENYQRDRVMGWLETPSGF